MIKSSYFIGILLVTLVNGEVILRWRGQRWGKWERKCKNRFLRTSSWTSNL